MKWITNSPKERAQSDIAELSVGHANRKIIIGKPKETEWMTSKEIESNEYIGLYDE